jgi:basic membrane lipoprotein Med (substrate-binding protein (PBP1-ABC) superfamily)
VVIDLPHAFLTVAREVKDGSFKPRVVALGGKSNVVRLVLNPALRDRVPAATLAAVDSTRTAIETGAFKVPAGDS